MDVAELSLRDLCAQTDTTARTVRYYIQQGLLPPPDGAGRGASYSPDHVRRLETIKLLKARHLPLAAIRGQLDAPADSALSADSALDYARAVLGAQRTPTPARRSTWERHQLTADVEFHVRRPLSEDDNRRVRRLLAFATDLFAGAP